MNSNNTNSNIILTPSNKRSSLSSRASKIPQKLAQSNFFSLRPSTSTLVLNNEDIPSYTDTSNRLSARIGQILFRQRTSSESVIKESRSFSTHNTDYSTLSLGRNSQQSRSLDMTNNNQSDIYVHNDNLSIDPTYNQSTTTTTPSPYYSTSSPERTDFYSYYYNNISAVVTAGPVTTTTKQQNTTTKDENSLFSPLSFSNSSVSSFTDSILINTTPPPMSPIISNSTNTIHILDLSDITFSHVREIETITDNVQHLIISVSCLDLLCQLNKCKETIENMYNSPIQLKEQEESIKSTVQDIKSICQTCLQLSKDLPSLSQTSTDGFKKEANQVMVNGFSTAQEYQEMKSDQMDENASWFRHHFVGKPYHTFIGSLQPLVGKLPLIDTDKKKKPEPKRRNSKSLLNSFLSSSNVQQQQPEVNQSSLGIISVIQERAKDFSGPGNGAASILGSQYRIIIRSKEPESARFIIHECMAKETQIQLENRGDGPKLNKMVSNDYKRIRPFSTHGIQTHHNIINAHPDNQNTFTSRMMRAAILSACPNIDLRSFKELSAESTIMAGLEKELLKYDEIHIPKNYKFGFLTIKNNQTTEEAWFSNTTLSTNCKDFLNIMGRKIELKGYQGYAAGLDTKTGESGQHAYISQWNDIDIMFHVAPLMPLQPSDKQQVLRKKHIGNDIVCIIFLEGEQQFNPKAIRSQFLHVYIVVKPELDQDNKRCWRVEVLSNKNVGKFGPPLPSPGVFNNDETLKAFLTLKLINAENAALKSDKFCVPNNKARLGLLSSHIETGLTFSTPQVVRSASTNRLLSNKPNKPKKNQEEELTKRRPKSVNNNKSNHQLQSSGSRLLREAILDEEKRRVVVMASTDIPPLPSVSRSTLLQDFKKGFSRKKTNSSTLVTPVEQKKVLRKTSQLKISSIPENTAIINKQQKIDEEMFVGKDINISSESFISTEQLFSITEKKQRPLPPKFMISSPTATTTTTTITSSSNGSSLSWR
ncbi:hypothetical protein BDF21DRAFT_428612 [Thamnidium elegans]|nr:hypothetical protein BDF21DRAFT_428612 [Thamnidium elegans]